MKGILPVSCAASTDPQVCEQQDSLPRPWLSFGWSQSLLDILPDSCQAVWREQSRGLCACVQSLLLWGSDILFLLTMLSVVQQQLQVRVRTGLFV